MKALLLLCLLAIPADDPFQAGLTAYREGRFADAFAAFSQAQRDSSKAPPEISYNLALSALRADKLSEAEAALNKIEPSSRAEILALRDFLRGNVAFARSEKAAMQAALVEAEPFAFDIAIAYAQAAKLSWEKAASSRADWPQARRNADRAKAQIEDLSRKKTEAQKKKNPGNDTVSLRPKSPEKKSDGTEKGETRLDAQTTPLRAQDVERLFEALKRKEQEKVDLRARQRAQRQQDVEKDW